MTDRLKHKTYSSMQALKRGIETRGFQNLPYHVVEEKEFRAHRERKVYKPVFTPVLEEDRAYIRAAGFAAERPAPEPVS